MYLLPAEKPAVQDQHKHPVRCRSLKALTPACFRLWPKPMKPSHPKLVGGHSPCLPDPKENMENWMLSHIWPHVLWMVTSCWAFSVVWRVCADEHLCSIAALQQRRWQLQASWCTAQRPTYNACWFKGNVHDQCSNEFIDQQQSQSKYLHHAVHITDNIWTRTTAMNAMACAVLTSSLRCTTAFPDTLAQHHTAIPRKY